MTLRTGQAGASRADVTCRRVGGGSLSMVIHERCKAATAYDPAWMRSLAS